MLHYLSCSRFFALALLFFALSARETFAHCFVGSRFFPATLATDDPCVADEMSLPTVAWSKTGDVPPANEWDVSIDFAKRITEDFGITIGDTWSNIHQPGGFTKAGFGNLDTTLQYQLLKDGPHELALLLGLIVEWGGTGAIDFGIGDAMVYTHADLLFRQRLWRSARTRSDGCAPSPSPDRSDTSSRPARSMSCKTPSFRRCWPMAHQSNTACRI